MVVKRAFSAPGKALLAGGYLVLDSKYEAYVVALSSRMHSVVSFEETTDPNTSTMINVKSVQFNNDQWAFKVDKNEHNNYTIKEINGLQNPFIEKTLFNVLNYFGVNKSYKISIEIFSDSGYHSQEKSVLKMNSYKQFHYHSETVTKVPKTGLGSSAGLVTVLTTALVSCFIEQFQLEPFLKIIHNLSQVSHCQAQGKVGSGFDVAAATFGSIIYRRFQPELINDLPKYDSLEYKRKLQKLIDSKYWGYKSENVKLPKGLRLIMGDVNNGSETVKLVSRVKQWYNKNLPESLEIYTKINEGNMAFIKSLEDLNELAAINPDKYDKILAALDNKEAITSLDSSLLSVQKAVNQIRSNFKYITKKSGADIEPDVQTTLLDNSIALNGVLTGLVPGAGGYDAIALITTEKCDIQEETKNNKKFERVSWLDLHQEDYGIVEECPTHYINFN
ncbi:related to Phosphomevalonate kinase [Saccharomycodes ludwigii]|uniref:Phosphomevalonate kinase n=1 Tax=Saccharomycodes ludwigii TaxID=36035 RepID=A0A376BD29_9ASCO|nr:hypothetical protein SCDLUD_002225 [Saccharomycodes ludwigii]KAH3902403.1 hypothetical protein SCDLUD_002225 [Saccharomycodes ludwigii]SSD62030.1 related to Phosphomevalonate kinase [Saccharomycodes ludwigii]